MEVASKENQLWALIHAKGLLHSDVQDLYRKVRFCYENIILNDNAQLELQDIEYSLWKLYYKLIDDFRKRIKRSSAAPRHDTYLEGFKLFLSEGIQFYQNLIVKIRECNGLTEESVLYRKGGTFTSGEKRELQKCQFLCHRFLVCLGDLARYKEQYEKPEVQSRNWSVAATHYLEATRIWPDSGNPQNQLAVLAMYIGDEFLALYHCIRSLAVKNPFPEAKDNLTLLFEKNRSSHLHSLSSECQFNFLYPSERSSVQITKQESNDNMLKAEMDTDLWPLMIRTLSFLHLKLSVDEFPRAFASTMKELDALMALDDTKLNAPLESYQRMDSVRRGPYRVLQVVSVLIFIIQNLVKRPETETIDLQKQTDMHQMELTQLALTATFIFMGRCVERCLKASTIETCPLLPAVLVFVEWLVFIFDEAETYGVDEKSRCAMSYFFGEFFNLLKRLNVNGGEVKYTEGVPLWEDHELRGFAPLATSHALLDFSSHWEHMDNYESGMDYRSQRIINAAIKIADRSTDAQKWIAYDKSERKFCKCLVTGSNGYPDKKGSGRLESNNSDVELNILGEKIDKAPEECEKLMSDGENPSSISVEEEEVILFRPLTRRNSAPISIASTLKDPTSPKHSLDQNVPSDECLRRATSLLIAQNPAQSDPYSFHIDMTHFGRNMSYKQQQQQPVVTDTIAQPVSENPVAAGPPSLNAWVFDRGSLSNGREKSTDGASKHGSRLSPIEEVASESLIGLSINGNEDSFSHHECASTLSSLASYTAPVPSAPPLVLDDDGIWFNEGISMANNASDVSYSDVTSYPYWTATQGPPNFSPIIPSFIDKYPTQHRMTSSEWLRQYRESHNLEHHGWPNYVHPPSNLGNLYGYDTSKFHHFSQWGTPEASSPSTLHPGFPLDPGFSGYQRTSPYACRALTDIRNEQQPLLQYLKEREKQLQRDPTVRGPSYMDN
ncbi:hypothetical protein ACLB2K_023851 [Fragaria x ananassa]